MGHLKEETYLAYGFEGWTPNNSSGTPWAVVLDDRWRSDGSDHVQWERELWEGGDRLALFVTILSQELMGFCENYLNPSQGQ